MTEPAVFVDRDGTLCEFVPYLSDPDRFRLLPTVPEGLRALNEAGVPVVVTTNQSGIGRGYFDRATVERVHETMLESLSAADAEVHDVYFCPHEPAANCDCRKPEPGLLQSAATDHDLALSRSYMVGDRETDVRAGNRVGATTVLFPSVETEIARDATAADHVVDEFRELVGIVLGERAI
ncbi:D-glycero-alpha-D-manno-heptose-1,7-bisphosphate 7-phosphatase [Haloarcula litorea]|uniref:D-glycero-alpha-D-manno-heptose-1,7-bisphosphate 7-phosphatase n=1 Tax=Haloarcula litorea TaxID=3032579 RepID=UPI0023E7B1E2|nr:HAD family hydrolase [Halomicroarcula sp. GDY20]